MAAVGATFAKMLQPRATIGQIAQPKLKKNRNPEFCAIHPEVLQVLMPCAPNQVALRNLSGVVFLARRFSDVEVEGKKEF